MFEPLVIWMAYRLLNFLVNVLWGISLALWYVEKAIGWLGDQIVTSNVWETIIDGLLVSLADSLPSTLSSILFGAGGGLFYLALILFGLMLLIPFLSRIQPVVEVERIFGWTLVVTVLFIASTAGYDLIGFIEQQRMGMMADIASGYGSSEVSQLVAGPMSATADEINVNEFELPAAYEEIYFPNPAAFETLEIVWYDILLLGSNISTVTIETDESIDNRISQATLGIVLVILNLIPTAMVVILVASFVGLTATSLVLVLFFLMALPLGMFEAGMMVINQILKRYLLVWILSIFMAVFPGSLLGIAELTLVPPVTMESLFLYIGVLLVAVYATYHVARWVFNIATDSFAAIGHSINAAAFGGWGASGAGGYDRMPLPGQSGAAPAPQPLPPHAALGVVGAAAAAPALVQSAVMGAKALPYMLFAGATWERDKEEMQHVPGTAIQSGNFGQIQAGNPAMPFGGDLIDGEWEEVGQPTIALPEVSESTKMQEELGGWFSQENGETEDEESA